MGASGKIDTTRAGFRAVNGEVGAIALGDAVYKNAVSGEMVLADADALLSARVEGLVIDLSIAPGAYGRFVSEGRLDGAGSGWAIGDPVYLSTSGTSGATLTQTAPSGSGKVLVRVGTAITPTDLLIEIESPVEL
jgi:hypothetical protein